jgi:hypothetical protein
MSLFLSFTLDSYAQTQFDNNNGNWNKKREIKRDTDEAQLMVRVGDIDNFGFGWPYNFNPFSGNDTSVHTFPWSTPYNEPQGLDRIMVVSGYDYYKWVQVRYWRSWPPGWVYYKKKVLRKDPVGIKIDGYTEQTSRPSNEVKPINLKYSKDLNGITVKNAILQMFVDDFQPGSAHGITNGNVHYKVWIDNTEIPELEKIINSLDQSGPRGKMITFQIPDRYLDLVRDGNLSIKIDDTRSGITGDGYAIDFVKLLINNKGFTNTGTIEGCVRDSQNANIKISGAIVSAGGVVSTTTDSNGYFRLEDVPAGQALVTVSKPGYKSQTKAINVVEYNTIRNQNFNLVRTEKISTPIFDYNPKIPTREDVIVTINYPGNPEIKEYKINDEPWQEYNGLIIMTENGIIQARGKDIYDEYENESEIGRLEIHNIDKTPPTAIIRYSTTDLTTDNVVATLEPSEDVTVTNNNGSLTYTFTENGSFVFEFEDAAGNRGSATATVNNINTFKLENLNVLEVQPNRNFELSEDMFSSISENITIDKMSMVEFISTIEKINGKYDIVYVGNNGGGYTHIGDRPNKLPQNGKKNGSESEEYYSENDITNRKAADLKDYIESGQLTIFDSSIFDDSLNQTKLYNNFKTDILKDNVKLTNDIYSEDIKQLYVNSNKRIIFKITDSPNDYNGNENSYESNKTMNFRFNLENLNTTNDSSNLMTIRLYIDKNGDGLFKEDEIVEQTGSRVNGQGYVINHSLPDVFTGMMPWKLEVEDAVTHVKSYEIGYPAYKGEKLKIRVLQLVPPKNTFSIKSMKVPLNTKYYEVEVTELTTTEFKNNYPNSINKGGEIIQTKLNGNYDMIILGFADGFENGDLTIEAINEIKEFIKTGQSVMFTHDTMSYHVNNYGKQCKNLTQQFRDIIGQSRYNNNPLKNNNNITYDNDEYYSEEIVHDSLPNSNKISYGFTKGILDVKNNVASGHPQISKTYKLNEGLYTRYPYILANNPQKQLNVATTHEQYFQLNLEDEDVIPWFTLNGESNTKFKNSNRKYVYDKYDGRNNYYTYTKGNITYSGTGHSSPNGTGNKLDEHKMFMNTIIKASRSANHAPTLEVKNLDENKIISKSQETFEFSFTANDIDGDPLSGEIYINDILVRSYGEGDINNNEPVGVSITIAELQRIVGDSEDFTIRIVVEDSKGAVAEQNGNFNMKFVDNPVLNLIKDRETKYLVGDTAIIKLQAKTQKTSDDLNTEIRNINYNISFDNSNGGIEISDTNWELENIIFNPDPTPGIQEKDFTFKVNKEGNYNISNTLSYEYSNFSDLGSQNINYDYTVSVKQGKIEIEVLNTDGTAFDNAQVMITKSNGKTITVNTDEYGYVALENELSGTGTYTISIQGLDEKYMVKGNNQRNVNLSYDNSDEKITFEIIDKTKIGLNLTSEGKNGYLVGDTANIKLKAVAQNEDENLNTTIRDINYSMTYNTDALELTTDSSWELNDVQINGENIPNNKEQTKELSFDIKKEGDYQIINTVSYKYLENMTDVRNAIHNIKVKSGKIKVKAVNHDNTPYENVEVKVTKGENVIAQGRTNSLGEYNLTDQPSGNYTVLIELPGGFEATGGNSRSFKLSYDNATENIEFKLDDSAVIVKNGVFANKQVNETSLKVVKGYDLNLGVEFKSYDKKPDIRFELDENINKIEFTLYRADDLSSPIKNIAVYKVERDINGDEMGITKLSDGNEVIDLSSISGNKELKIEIPQSDTFNNHYILEYKISQDAPENSTLNNRVTINKTASREFDIKVVPLPKLE